MEPTTAIVVATAVAGFLAPFTTAVLSRPAMSSNAKRMIAAGVALALGVVAMFVTGSFVDADPASWGTGIVAVLGVSQALYALILKPTGVAPAIEAATTDHDRPEAGA